MNRILAIALLITLGGTAFAQRDMSQVQIKPTKLSDAIYMFEGSGGNIGVSIGEDGVLIIDDQFAPLAKKIQTAIDELGGSKPAFILNTHHHGDHTGGNAAFGEHGVIIAHQNVRNRLAGQDKAGLPEITYDKGLSVHFNGEELRIIHFPNAHTDGDGVVFFTKSNIVHTGDLCFNGRFPFVDLSGGGSVQGYIEALRSIILLASPDAQIIPGHGSLATVSDLQNSLDMMEMSAERAQKALEAGQSLEAFQAEGMPAEYGAWGSGFINTDKWLSTVYNSYKE